MIHPFLTHIISFLIGAIPMGYLLAKLHGIDIQSKGSGNTGATNVARVLGKRTGIITLLADVLKGSIGCAYIVLFSDGNIPEASLATHGFAAVVGHCYSPFLGFKGGKGVATSLGVIFVLSPAASVIVLTSFGLCLWISHYVSLASMFAALSYPIGVWLLAGQSPDPVVFYVSLLFALLVVIRHEQNIKRLRNGEERKFV